MTLQRTLTPQQELLTQLEAIHALTAEGILALRERIQNQDKYTVAALAEMDKRLAERVGQAQLLADKLPDHRTSALAVTLPRSSGGVV